MKKILTPILTKVMDILKDVEAYLKSAYLFKEDKKYKSSLVKISTKKDAYLRKK